MYCIRLGRVSGLIVAILSLSGLVGVAWSQEAQPSHADPSHAGHAHAATQPAATRPTTGPSPVAFFEETEYRFGKIEAGKDIVHTFKARNKGDKELNILNVHPTCGCTVATGWANRVPPGGSWELPVTVKTTGFSGNVVKTVIVGTSDPEMATIELKLIGEIITRYKYEPKQMFHFGRIDKATEVSQSIKIINQMDPPTKLKQAKVVQTDPATGKPLETASFKVELREQQDGKVYEVVLSTIPPLKEGGNQGNVEIATEKEGETLRLPIYAQVPPRIEVIPQMVYVPEKIARQLVRTITVRNNTKSAVKITDVSTTESAIKTEVKQSNDGSLFTVMLTIPEGTTIPTQGASVTIKTDDKDVPQVTLPIAVPPNRPMAAPATRSAGALTTRPVSVSGAPR